MIDIDNPSRADFAAWHVACDINPAFAFEDYLELCRERREMRDYAEQQGWRRGYEEPPDLEDPESLRYLAMIALGVTEDAAEEKRAA